MRQRRNPRVHWRAGPSIGPITTIAQWWLPAPPATAGPPPPSPERPGSPVYWVVASLSEDADRLDVVSGCPGRTYGSEVPGVQPATAAANLVGWVGYAASRVQPFKVSVAYCPA